MISTYLDLQKCPKKCEVGWERQKIMYGNLVIMGFLGK